MDCPINISFYVTKKWECKIVKTTTEKYDKKGNVSGDREYQERQQPTQETRFHCSVSTLPYAISKWSEQSPEIVQPHPESSKKPKLSVKSESESAVASPTRPPVELRRKLSLLEEKRAIFQRRRYETSQDSSDDISSATVVAASIDLSRKDSCDPESSGTKKRVRQISVRTFDTFSTFEGTFDEDTGVGYLAGIEEDYGENYLTDRRHAEDDNEISEEYNFAQDYGDRRRTMQNVGDNADQSRSMSQESAVRNSNLYESISDCSGKSIMVLYLNNIMLCIIPDPLFRGS